MTYDLELRALWDEEKDQYSKYDEVTGMPTHDKDGNLLQGKKWLYVHNKYHAKIFELHERMWTDVRSFRERRLNQDLELFRQTRKRSTLQRLTVPMLKAKLQKFKPSYTPGVKSTLIEQLMNL